MSMKIFAFTVSFIFLVVGARSTFAQTAKPIDEPITLETPTGSIYGALLIPASKKPCPVVVIVAGSGPTDRNGNTPMLPGANNSLKMLADGLAASGIASLRCRFSTGRVKNR